ncbi:K+-transporting ATPase ATPase C chain [Kitasatospora sp. MAP12-15]|uniref:potassium-transporting ATPase subunit KdpC n=1 Tax=unclassified Kitasatospora TaxID=2633591 RepID=UPI002473BBAE|nr:potassium-transporting ATPase subunit KdpC [Kitasatospora sp. MAP12-44]MDH6109349.1 K+-transporting ATPase ATPase C chain [Kitasatospora sp. MAP12-44]
MARHLPTLVRLHLTALRLLLVFTVLCGLAYPLLITGIAQLALSGQANGSQVRLNGRTVGSSLLGQTFDLPKKNPADPNEQPRPDPRWFQPRPSAAGSGYDALASGASNFGPNDATLTQAVKARRAAIAAFDGVAPDRVPPDALTGSASGLDPAISPAYADLQVDRVARARGLDPGAVRRLVQQHLQGRSLGFLGQGRVDVVTLNLALARLG